MQNFYAFRISDAIKMIYNLLEYNYTCQSVQESILSDFPFHCVLKRLHFTNIRSMAVKYTMMITFSMRFQKDMRVFKVIMIMRSKMI